MSLPRLFASTLLTALIALGCGAETSETTGQDGGTTVTDAGSSDAGSDPVTDAGSGGNDCTTHTYANFGEAFFATNCNGCHTSQQPRLTSQSAIKTNAARCRNEITSGRMPPYGTLSEAQKTAVVEWLDCGAP
jgi:hypothetical protein